MSVQVTSSAPYKRLWAIVQGFFFFIKFFYYHFYYFFIEYNEVIFLRNILSREKIFLKSILKNKPNAYALLHGNKANSSINGKISFYFISKGCLVVSEIFGLPKSNEKCIIPIFAYHIHENGDCSLDKNDTFSKVGSHLNNNKCDHPYHMGDMPPIFSNNGYAFSVFYTERFKLSDVYGKSVIIHSKTDDFKTQPSGDAGEKIACGIIVS